MYWSFLTRKPDPSSAPICPHSRLESKQPPVDVVISGSYRKQFEALQQTYEQFRDMGCTILSPSSVSIVHEDDGFVYMRGEETETPESIEERHLDAIQRANFVWLHAPEGYVGPMAALEIGYASAVGVPVYAKELPSDKRFQPLVRLVDSPADLLATQAEHSEPPALPVLRAFQEYYRRAHPARLRQSTQRAALPRRGLGIGLQKRLHPRAPIVMRVGGAECIEIGQGAEDFG